MKTPTTLNVLVLLCAVLILSQHVRATAIEMYGAEFEAFGEFYFVDTSDGSVSTIGNTGGFLSSMDFSASGVLYAASGTLEEVDPATGLTSNRRSINFIGGPESDIITGLTFSSTQGLFGIGNGPPGNLWRIDPVSADAHFVGSSGEALFALEFGPDGTLYGAGHDLWEISTDDGSATLIGRVGDGALLTALDFAPDGLMYGASSDITSDALYTINLETGAGLRIGVTNANLVSLASIPEPTTGVLLGLGGLALLRKRRA
ncbi:MAG: PEP-CTERM sorting domain-containing protein [Phycisphaerales bacterium]|nr:MAG: PEP-CTERM sorting domain-containing protein [Phycisphaerales bacterium]